MTLKEMSPLNRSQYKFVIRRLAKEEKKRSIKRLQRLEQAKLNAKQMKTIYH